MCQIQFQEGSPSFCIALCPIEKLDRVAQGLQETLMAQEDVIGGCYIVGDTFQINDVGFVVGHLPDEGE